MADHDLHFQANLLLDSLPLSPVTTCGYFVDRQSRFREFRMEEDPGPEWLEVLLARGYRRCGDVYYQTRCPACHACQSWRIRVNDFRPSRSQRRVLRRNDDVESRWVDPVPDDTKARLYLRYQHEQHHRKDQQRSDPALRASRFAPRQLLRTMAFQMYTNPAATREHQLWLDGTLVGFGNVDVAARSASAVYFVFDPEHGERSLGTLAILRGIEWARRQGLHYYYLGYYIAGHPKMSYKARFLPADYHDPATDTWSDAPPP